MSEQDEFQEIGPRVAGREAVPCITVGFGKDSTGWARVSRMAMAALALTRQRHVSIAVSKSGVVRIRPTDESGSYVPKMGLDGSIPRIASYCKQYGYRDGFYPVEVRDGALYFQLERIVQEDAA